MTFKKASEKQQAKLRRPINRRLGDFDIEEPTDKAALEMLREKARLIDRQIIALPKGDPKRRELGLQKFELGKKIQALSNSFGKIKPLANFFMDVCRESLPPTLFEALLNKATILQDEDAKFKKGLK